MTSRLGVCIRQLREQRGISLQDVATRASLSKAHVWNLEQGTVVNPTIQSLVSIAVAMGVDASVLTDPATWDCLKRMKIETVSHQVVIRR